MQICVTEDAGKIILGEKEMNYFKNIEGCFLNKMLFFLLPKWHFAYKCTEL